MPPGMLQTKLTTILKRRTVWQEILMILSVSGWKPRLASPCQTSGRSCETKLIASTERGRLTKRERHFFHAVNDQPGNNFCDTCCTHSMCDSELGWATPDVSKYKRGKTSPACSASLRILQ